MSAATFLNYFLIIWMSALSALVGFRLLTGRIDLTGVLSVEGTMAAPSSARPSFSPARLQLLVTTVAGLAAYATASLSARKMVPIHDDLVALFALSHVCYMGPKAFRSFRKKKL